MKGFAGFILSFIIILGLLFLINNPQKLNLDSRKGNVVVEMTNDFIFGHMIYSRHSNPDSTKIYYDRVYEIVTINLNVGDTIK